MDKKQLKQKIKEACINQQQKAAENAMREMKEAHENANEYGTPEDWFDTYKSDMLNKRDIYSQQLQKILEEIRILERIDANTLLDKVAFGAVVKTETQNLFISIGIGKIIVDNEIYYAISPSVPLFQAIKGKKAGDTFEFRGNKQKIIDVF